MRRAATPPSLTPAPPPALAKSALGSGGQSCRNSLATSHRNPMSTVGTMGIAAMSVGRHRAENLHRSELTGIRHGFAAATVI